MNRFVTTASLFTAALAAATIAIDSAQAAPIIYSSDDFEAAAGTLVGTDATDWENVNSNGQTADTVALVGFSLSGAGSTSVRVRKASPQIRLNDPDTALTLASDGITSLTLQMDYRGNTNGNTLAIEYSALGDFSDAFAFGTIDTSPSTGTGTTLLLAQQFTVTDAQVTFTDTAALRIRGTGGSTANNSGTIIDNVLVSGVPEPGSLVLLTAGGLCVLRRRRQN
ncbi:MAG: PEP-CTERM sorting domain-containing protein [Planctomycetota bacterium]